MHSEQVQGVSLAVAMSYGRECCLHLLWEVVGNYKEKSRQHGDKLCQQVHQGIKAECRKTDNWWMPQVDGGNVLIIRFASDPGNTSLLRKISVN